MSDALPDHDALVDLAERVTDAWGVAMPSIDFVDHHLSHQHDTGIVICSNTWVDEYQAASRATYALLMLHELAHWIATKRVGRMVGHVKEFYVLLYALVEEYGEPFGLTPEMARDDEVEYKPRGARAGWRMFEEVRT